MTKSEAKTTLLAVIKTMDSSLSIQGINNMTSVVGCCNAIQNVLNNIDNLTDDEETKEG